MKKLAITVLLVALSLCGCADSPRFRRAQDQADAEHMCLAEFCAEQQNSTVLHAERWTNKYGPGIVLTTQHYEVYTTLLNPFFLAKIPDFMEAAHQAYTTQIACEVQTAKPAKVYVFKNRQQWEDYTRLLTGSQAELFLKIRQGAYCYNGTCVAYDIGPERTLAALSHEGWHQFSHRYFKYRLPSWLDEGLAMQFEGFSCVNDQYVFAARLNRYRIGALSSVLNEQASLALKDLLCISPGEVMATDRAESVMAFYSQSYALVRFLREANAGKYLAHYQRLMQDGLLGQWPICVADRKVAENRDLARTIDWNGRVGMQLFQAYVCNEVKALEQEYLSFCWQITQEGL